MGILSFLFSRAEPQNPAPQKQIRRYYNKYDIIPTDYTVIDTETSGFSPSTFEILEIAAIRVRNHVEVSRYHTYIRPEGAISPDASKVNGLTWPKLRNKPFLKDVKQKFLDFIGDDVLVGHNIGFDIRFIQTRCEIDLQNKCFDTLRWSRLVFPHISDYKLDTLRRALSLGGEAHSALGDCVATHQLLQHIANSDNNFAEINNHYKANRVSCIQSLVFDYDDHDDDDNFEVGFGYWSEGEAARLQGDFNKALELFNRAESEGYSCPAIFTSYAMVYRKQKDYENELAIIEKALKVFDGKASFTTATKNFLNRKERVEQLILAQKKREELMQEKQAIREAKAEERRKKADMAASEPKKPRTRSIAQCLDDGTIIKEYESIAAAAREVGSSTKNIRDAANGKQHHACGFCWRYLDVGPEE